VPDNVVDFLLQTTIHTDSVASNEEKQRRKLTIEEVVGHLNSIIGGGFGTTNAALAFVLHQLTVNEDIMCWAPLCVNK
jgi:cytochrome P450